MAIALDATSSSENQTGTSVTFAHTCSGSNRALIVATSAATTVSQHVSSITYNGVALTNIAIVDETTNQNRIIELWYLLAPATGANNIVVTYGTAPNTFYSVAAASYTGVKQSAQPDASGTATSGAGTVTAISKSITTIADNCWIVGVSCNLANGTSNTADAGSFLRLSVYQRVAGSYEEFFLDSNGAKTPAGSYSLGYSWTTAAKATLIAASLAPAIATTNSGFFNFM